MALLGFAFLAGVVTALAPCILPVLPILLAGGTAHGRGRPWGIILGTILSFSAFTLTLAWLVDRLGLPPDIGRTVGIILLVALGLTLAVPLLRDRFEAWVSRRLARSGSAQTPRRGFGGGLFLGISLGAVWTPCAGPILASVTTVTTAGVVNANIILVTIAYATGAALPMGLIAALGQRIVRRIRWVGSHAGQVQQAFGAVLLLVALLMVTNVDRRIQAAVVSVTPEWLNTIQRFEDNAALEQIDPKAR
ncbi:MAG: cytochrome c biogenesis protein CcdA [Candidatus Kerfeldbacteria bacterium]|nr:cytochrome c biogenesis protein CcdA [Candidatus Kerfeldbacteria bacterium]